MRMSFGKYSGVFIADLPDDYLMWLHGLDNLKEPLRSAIDREYAARFGTMSSAPNFLSSDLRQMVQEVVSAGYRKLSLVHHPDRGGESKAMTLLNEAAEWLRQQMRTT
jgi:hypothetical protein